MDLAFLPALNATLNGLSGVLLVFGVILIKQNRPLAHRRCMLGAFGVSTLFLICYLTHKIWKANTGQEMHTTYHGQGWLKGAYLLILLTHLVLAMMVPVLAIWLIRLGLTGRTQAHRRLARWTLPIWLYVSLTGVVIYFMLYHFNPPAPGNSPGNLALGQIHTPGNVTLNIGEGNFRARH